VNAPIIDELPFCMECKVISYDDKSCRLLGEIVNVSADESVLSPDGKIDVQKLAPITYDSSNHAYIKLGDKVGNAFKDGAKFKK
jgi:flavin reductase (DIM6/NTAB) family NADH-FMN oxidoreductase RutF